MVSKGAGHIGTTLDSQYLGCSLVAIHNHSSEPLKLKVGSEFVTLQFWYLNSSGYQNAPSHDNEPGHPRMLNGFEDVDKYIEWRDKNTWTTKRLDLYHRMTESDEYQRCKSEYQRELDKFNEEKRKQTEELNRKSKEEKIKKYCIIIGSVILICVLLSIPAYIVKINIISTICKNLCEKVIFPVMATVITTYVIIDFREKK